MFPQDRQGELGQVGQGRNQGRQPTGLAIKTQDVAMAAAHPDERQTFGETRPVVTEATIVRIGDLGGTKGAGCRGAILVDGADLAMDRIQTMKLAGVERSPLGATGAPAERGDGLRRRRAAPRSLTVGPGRSWQERHR